MNGTKLFAGIGLALLFLCLVGWGIHREMVEVEYNREREVFEEQYSTEVTAVYIRLSEWRQGIYEIIQDGDYIPFALAMRCRVLSDDLGVLADHYEEVGANPYCRTDQPYCSRAGFGMANSALVEWLRQEAKSYDLAAQAYSTRETRNSLAKELDQQDQVARKAKLLFWDYGSSRMDIKQDDPYWGIFAHYSAYPVARLQYNRRLGLSDWQGANRDAVMSYIWLLNFWRSPIELVDEIDSKSDRADRFLGYLGEASNYWGETDQWGAVSKIDSDLSVHFGRLRQGEESDPLLSTLYLRGEMSCLHITKEFLTFE